MCGNKHKLAADKFSDDNARWVQGWKWRGFNVIRLEPQLLSLPREVQRNQVSITDVSLTILQEFGNYRKCTSLLWDASQQEVLSLNERRWKWDDCSQRAMRVGLLSGPGWTCTLNCQSVAVEIHQTTITDGFPFKALNVVGDSQNMPVCFMMLMGFFEQTVFQTSGMIERMFSLVSLIHVTWVLPLQGLVKVGR